MKSLAINEILHNWSGMNAAVNKITAAYEQDSLPVSIEGIQGCLFSYFIQDFCRHKAGKTLQAIQYSASSKSAPKYTSFSSDILIVVPSEFEAQNLETDFRSIFPEAELFVFPTWGVQPYKPAATGSVTFGKRAGFLSKLVQKNKSSCSR